VKEVYQTWRNKTQNGSYDISNKASANIIKPLISLAMPRNIFAAALRDSAAVVLMVNCITQAIFLMMYCITPQ